MLAAVIYGLAAALTLGIKEPAVVESVHRQTEALPEEKTTAPLSSKWHTLTEGWIMIWRMPRLRLLTLMELIDMLGGSVWVGAFTLAFVQAALGQSEEWCENQ